MRKAYSEVLLLDVNVLLSLAWPNHQFHQIAIRRLEREESQWATCAITQLGFIRLSSNPAVVGIAKSPREAAHLLTLLVRDARHLYLESLPAPSSREFLQGFERIFGFRQVTDSYLIGLARQSNARLLTFDSRLAALSQGQVEVELLLES